MNFDSSAVIWVVVAIVAAVIEIATPHFGIVFASLGAAAAAIVASLGYGGVAQWVVFLVAFGVSFGVLRPRLVGRLGAKGVPSRTDSLIGRDGIVTHDIETTIGSGRVNVGGEDWAARAATPLRAGTRIRVVAADGIVLEVKSA